MKNNKTMLLYHEYIETIFAFLTDEEIGTLIKAILKYDMTGEIMGKSENRLLDFAFAQMKADCDRNSQKYAEICEKNRKNGEKGGRPSEKASGLLENPKNPVGYSGLFEKPKKPYKDKDKDKYKEKDKDKESARISEILGDIKAKGFLR